MQQTQAQALIESIARTRAQLQEDPSRTAKLQALQRWQLERLQRTYEDYLRRPTHRAALEFFMHDLYGPHDFSERDRDLKRVIDIWLRVLPERAVNAVTAALELEALSQSLDLSVLDALGEAAPDEHTYARAYREANRRPDRERQIALITMSGRALDELIRNPWINRALRMARTPARMAGFQALHEFLERGYRSFAKMGSAAELLTVIEQRERTIMERLFSGAVDPFAAEEERRGGPVRRGSES